MKISKIQINDLNFTYKGIPVYKNNLNAYFERGNIYLIKGRNGSGKSTLAGILLKVWNDFSGIILIDEKNIREFSRDEIVTQIGICFQKTPIFQDTIRNNISLRENIDVEKYISLLSFNEDLENMGRTLESDLIDTGSVSGGQAQKIGIIRTICRERSVYIFDEPTSNLDVASKEKFYNILCELKNKSIIILFSHEEAVEMYSDYTIQL